MVTRKNPNDMHTLDSRETTEHKRLVMLVRETIDLERSATTMSWIEEIIDPMIYGNYDKVKVELVVKVALQCVAKDKDDIPTMNHVVEMLLSHEE